MLISPSSKHNRPYYTRVSSGGPWQLDIGHYTPRRWDMIWVHPRPDTDSPNTYARQKNAYPGLEWSIPLRLTGGSKPYHFEIISGPTGATLDTTRNNVTGNTYTTTLVWQVPAGASGNYPWVIRAYDQEYGRGASPSSYVDVSFTTNVNTTNFIFLDKTSGSPAPVNGGTGDGSLANPFKDIPDWYLGSETDATYVGKIVVYKSGSYSLDKWGSGTPVWCRMDSTIKPWVHIKYPGATVSFECSITGFIIQSHDCSDWYTDIDFTNTVNQTGANAKGIWFSAPSGKRITLLGNASNLGRGTTGNDNPGAYDFAYPGDVNTFEYVTISGKLTGTNSAPFYDTYGIRYSAQEDIDLSGSTNSWVQVLFNKANYQYVSMSYINGYLPSFTGQSGVIEGYNFTMAGTVNSYPDKVEVSYCYLASNTTGFPSRAGTVVFDIANQGSTNPSVNWYLDRCTILGICHADSASAQTLHINGCLFVYDGATAYQTSVNSLTVVDGADVTNHVYLTTDGAVTLSTGACAGPALSYAGINGWVTV